MFLSIPHTDDEETVSFIGKFLRSDGESVVLQHGQDEVFVKHNGLDGYQTTYVLVTGVYTDGTITEESVRPVSDDLDYKAYLKLVSVSAKYSGTIF